jgi:hypothetical protein
MLMNIFMQGNGSTTSPYPNNGFTRFLRLPSMSEKRKILDARQARGALMVESGGRQLQFLYRD